MGWSDLGDGCYDGDGPADATAETMDLLAQRGRERTGSLPTGESVLRAFLAALRLDGSNAPFYAEPKRVESMTVTRAGKTIAVDANGAEPWLVAELYEMLDVVAGEYTEAWLRAPRLQELVHYLRRYFEDEDAIDEHLTNDGPWKLRPATFVFGKHKASDRADPPAVSVPSRPRRRATHPKFGEGEIIREEGDRLTIDFRDGRRVLLRKFVTLSDD